jgi:hypothetical protein
VELLSGIQDGAKDAAAILVVEVVSSIVVILLLDEFTSFSERTSEG